MRRALSLFERNLATFFAAYSLIFIAFAALSPIVGDYCPYLQQWHNVSVGLDPWLNDETQVVHHIPWVSFCGTFYATAPNAYGPLFNVYGMTSLIFPTIPRVLGCILFLAVSWMIAKRVHARQELDWKIRFWLYAGLLDNLLSFLLVTIVGGNDVYIAFFVCCALFAFILENEALAGAALGIGALIKFYPLYLVPFLALDRRRLSVKFIAVAVAIFVLGMGLAYLVWGQLIFKPLFWNLGRGASRSSIIFIFALGLGKLFHVAIPASRLVLMTLAPAAIAALIVQYQLRLSRLTGFMIGYLVILIFNQISYPEYYFPLMMTIFIYVLNENPPPALIRALAILFMTILLNAAFFTLVTNYKKESFSGIRVGATLIVTLIDVYLIVELIRQGRRAVEPKFRAAM